MSEESIYAAQRRPSVEIIDASNTEIKLVVVFDAVVNEDHAMSATVTEHPIEDGSIISDHVIQQPDQLTLRGIVSNSPINLVDSYAVTGRDDVLYTAETVGSVKTLDTMGGPLTGQPQTSKLPAIYLFNKDSSASRANAAYAIMKEKLKKAIPLTIKTGLDTYTDMIVTDIKSSRDAMTADSWMPSITFKKIVRVQTKEVKLKVQKKGQPRNSSTKKENKGAITPQQELRNKLQMPIPILAQDKTKVFWRPKAR